VKANGKPEGKPDVLCIAAANSLGSLGQTALLAMRDGRAERQRQRMVKNGNAEDENGVMRPIRGAG
jgi:hypothetical protein